MGVRLVILALYIPALFSCAQVKTIPPNDQYLKQYGVAYCLSTIYPKTKYSNDSRYVSGVYLQKGTSGIDRYEEIRNYVDKYMENKYISKHDRNLGIMQCIDLFGSPYFE